MAQFEIGDFVVVHKPEGEPLCENACIPYEVGNGELMYWNTMHMNKYNGIVSTIINIHDDGAIQLKECGGYCFHADWLEKVYVITAKQKPTLEEALDKMSLSFSWQIKCKCNSVTVTIAKWTDGRKGKAERKKFDNIFDTKYAIDWLILAACDMSEDFRTWYHGE